MEVVSRMLGLEFPDREPEDWELEEDDGVVIIFAGELEMLESEAWRASGAWLGEDGSQISGRAED